MRVRKEPHRPKTIIRGWNRCILLRDGPDIALAMYRRQMHTTIAGTHVSEQEESVFEAEVGKIPNLKAQTK